MGRTFNPDIRQIQSPHFQQRWARDLIGYSTPLVNKVATGAGSAVTPQAQSYLLTTGAAGANKGIEFYEYMQGLPFYRNVPGENYSLFSKYNYLEGFFDETAMTSGTQEGLAFYGIEIGSFLALVPPVDWNTSPAGLTSRIQFRRNLERFDYEISVYADLGTTNDPILELCDIEGEAGLMSIIYRPKESIDFYTNNIRIHSFKDKQILNAMYGASIPDNAGFGAFATSGSNAGGQTVIALNKFCGFTDLY